MQKRSVINSPGVVELKNKRKKALKTKIIIFSVIVFLFVVSIILATKIEKININQIQVSGNVVIDTKAIETIANSYLSQHYLGIIPKTNFLIYPKNQIKKELQNKYKRIKNITISENGIRTLAINVEEYEGKYLYCGNVIPELNSKSDQKCYFMDSNGYIFDEAPFFSGEVYFKFYGNVGNDDNPIGTYFNNSIFNKLVSLKESVSKMDLSPAYAFVDNNQNEIYLNLSNSGSSSLSPNIILKIDSDFGKDAENLESAIGTDPLKTKLKNNYSSLLYIDLRFGNKVYYKFSTQKEALPVIE